MEQESSPQKRKIHRLVGFLALIAAVFGGIDLIINPTLLDIVVEIVLLANAVIHWKDLLKGRSEARQRIP